MMMKLLSLGCLSEHDKHEYWTLSFAGLLVVSATATLEIDDNN